MAKDESRGKGVTNRIGFSLLFRNMESNKLWNFVHMLYLQ